MTRVVFRAWLSVLGVALAGAFGLLALGIGEGWPAERSCSEGGRREGPVRLRGCVVDARAAEEWTTERGALRARVVLRPAVDGPPVARMLSSDPVHLEWARRSASMTHEGRLRAIERHADALVAPAGTVVGWMDAAAVGPPALDLHRPANPLARGAAVVAAFLLLALLCLLAYRRRRGVAQNRWAHGQGLPVLDEVPRTF